MRLCLLKKNNKTRGKTSGAIGLDLGVFVLGLVGPTPESTPSASGAIDAHTPTPPAACGRNALSAL